MKKQKELFSNTNNNVNFSIQNKMVRLIKSGLSAVYVFALVMTVTLTARATEKAVVTAKEKVATERVALATSVEAMTMAVTVEKLIAKWAMEKALQRPKELEVMKEPVDTIREMQEAGTNIINPKILKLTEHWYSRNPNGTYSYQGEIEPGGCDPEVTLNICAKMFSVFKDPQIVNDTYTTDLVTTTYVPDEGN